MPILVVTNYQSKVLVLISKCGHLLLNTACNIHWLVAIGFNTKNIFSHYVVQKKKNSHTFPVGIGQKFQRVHLCYFCKEYFPDNNPIF